VRLLVGGTPLVLVSLLLLGCSQSGPTPPPATVPRTAIQTAVSDTIVPVPHVTGPQQPLTVTVTGAIIVESYDLPLAKSAEHGVRSSAEERRPLLQDEVIGAEHLIAGSHTATVARPNHVGPPPSSAAAHPGP